MSWLRLSLSSFCFVGVLSAGVFFLGLHLVETSLRENWRWTGPSPEVDSLRLTPRGLYMRLGGIAPSGVRAEGVHVRVPWANYIGRGVSRSIIDVSIERLEVNLGVCDQAHPFSVATYSEKLVHVLGGLPCQEFQLEIERVDLNDAPIWKGGSLNASILRAENGESHVAGVWQSLFFDFEFQARVPVGDDRFDFDFAGSLDGWEELLEKPFFQRNMSRSFDEVFSEIMNLGAGLGVIEFSGYTRWDGANASDWIGALLGNVGAVRWTNDSKHIHFSPGSYGIARDMEGRVRAFGRAEVDSIGSARCRSSEGALDLRVSEGYLSGELRVEEWFTFSFGRFEIFGDSSKIVDVDCFLECAPVDVEWMKAFDFKSLPEDSTGAIGFEGIAHWDGVNLSLEGFTGQISMIELASVDDSLFIPNIEAKVKAQVENGEFRSIHLLSSQPSFDETSMVAESLVFESVDRLFTHLLQL